MSTSFMETFPFILPTNQDKFTQLALSHQELTKNVLTQIESILLLIKEKYQINQFKNKMLKWHRLTGQGFIKELENARKKSLESHYSRLSLDEELEWLKLFTFHKKQIEELELEISKIDRKIDQLVYKLYSLTQEEIEIVEHSVKSR